MKATQNPWKPRLAAAAVLLALPLAALAQGPSRECFDNMPPPHFGGQPGQPAPGMFGAAPSQGGLPPHLHGIELSEVQQDKLFALRHEQAPKERELRKAADKARDNLRRLASADFFDGKQAQALAASHGQALGQLALMQAESDFKLRALLTPEQRNQIEQARGNDEPRGEPESRRGAKRP
jgi:Spy/CpxP family protein refolding chaperone